MREDILMEMEALELPDDQARALLACLRNFTHLVFIWRGYCPLSLGLRRPVHSKPPAGVAYIMQGIRDAVSREGA